MERPFRTAPAFRTLPGARPGVPGGLLPITGMPASRAKSDGEIGFSIVPALPAALGSAWLGPRSGGGRRRIVVTCRLRVSADRAHRLHARRGEARVLKSAAGSQAASLQAHPMAGNTMRNAAACRSIGHLHTRAHQHQHGRCCHFGKAARRRGIDPRSVRPWPGHVSMFGNDRIPGTSCPGQTMTDAMLTKPSPPGKAFRPWLCLRWMTPRIHKQ